MKNNFNSIPVFCEDLFYFGEFDTVSGSKSLAKRERENQPILLNDSTVIDMSERLDKLNESVFKFVKMRYQNKREEHLNRIMTLVNSDIHYKDIRFNYIIGVTKREDIFFSVNYSPSPNHILYTEKPFGLDGLKKCNRNLDPISDGVVIYQPKLIGKGYSQVCILTIEEFIILKNLQNEANYYKSSEIFNHSVGNVTLPINRLTRVTGPMFMAMLKFRYLIKDLDEDLVSVDWDEVLSLWDETELTVDSYAGLLTFNKILAAPRVLKDSFLSTSTSKEKFRLYDTSLLPIDFANEDFDFYQVGYTILDIVTKYRFNRKALTFLSDYTPLSVVKEVLNDESRATQDVKECFGLKTKKGKWYKFIKIRI